MEPKTVEEKTMDPAEWNRLDENEDEVVSTLEVLLDGPSSINSPMMDSPVTMKKVIVKFSSKTMKSTDSEPEDSDEMDTATTTTDHDTDATASSDETNTIGNESMLPVEDLYPRFTVEKYNKNPAGEPDKTGAIKDYNMNPCRESDETSATGNHNMDLANEPVQTSTSVDHEQKPAKEPNETSNTADLRTSTVESSNNKKVEYRPFNLLGCPDNVVHQILRCVLFSDEQIKPFWNVGALEVAAEQSGKENFTTVLVAFAGSKKLVDEATTILYGENVFKLQHAKVSLWWLERIGSNISKIKRLAISVEEGVMDQFGTRSETLWYSIFLLLEAKHRLQCLKVSFAEWGNGVDDGDGLDPDRDIYVWEPRYGILRTLLSFRGLELAFITPGPYVGECYAELLEDALIMSPGQSNEELTEFEQEVEEPKRTKYLF